MSTSDQFEIRRCPAQWPPALGFENDHDGDDGHDDDDDDGHDDDHDDDHDGDDDGAGGGDIGDDDVYNFEAMII